MKKSFKFHKMNLVNLGHLVIILFMLNACDETKQTGSKPDGIVSHEVVPIHGGAIITYSINDPNILYVMAEYERGGKTFTERSSAYNNTLTIEGFNTMNPVSAILYTVSRDSETKSDPTTVSFVPLESLISLASKSFSYMPDFGGVRVSWENIARTELSVHLMIDSLGEWIEKDVYYSSRASDNHPFRGFEAIETSFALTFGDKWGNISEPIYFTETPLVEIEIPKPWTDMREWMPYDNQTNLNDNLIMAKIWDGGPIDDLNCRWLTVNGSQGSSFTFDLGVTAKLSRVMMWPSMAPQYVNSVNVYGQVHIFEFEMWGTTEFPSTSQLADLSYWLHPFSALANNLTLPAHTFMDDWTYLGLHAIERIDQQGASEDDIGRLGRAGHSFEIAGECGPVRYIRFFPRTTASGGPPPPNNYWQISELSFFGGIVSQE